VPVSEIIGSVSPCGAGFAHPNICCGGGACVAHPAAPFGPCASDSLIFPDRRQCCPLDGAGTCVDTGTDGAAADAGAAGRCSLPCGPEGRPSDDPTFPACGNVLVSGIPCSYCCSGGSCTSDVCRGCPPIMPDGGVCDCGFPECGACPSGWGVAAAQVDLCCASAIRCFSQSSEVRAPAGGGMSGGPNGCESVNFAGGHLYDVKCDVRASSCTCSFDSTTTMQFDSALGDCSLARCGFSI
jgi:hypothetical protein